MWITVRDMLVPMRRRRSAQRGLRKLGIGFPSGYIYLSPSLGISTY